MESSTMSENDIESFYPTNRQQWRAWLQENHEKKASVWLICYKMKSGMPSISWTEAVEEALCFGWIDSTRKTIDDDKYRQFFSRRKKVSTWSKINKDKVEQLIADGSMTVAGLKAIETAKQNGSWILLDEVEALTIPDDLETAFQTHPGSKVFYLSLSKSVKKRILYWLVSARRPETREKRIREVAESAAQKRKPTPLV